MHFKADIAFAKSMDQHDPLRKFRAQFFIPETNDGVPCIYLCGNSLGLQPKSARGYVLQELRDWEKFGVEGHFHAKNPWMPYHRFLAESTARLVGAKPSEVVTMNSLTVNLHLLMVSFYCPTPQRHKILIEANAFPSDQYAVKSQIQFHGYDPESALLELPLRPGEVTHRSGEILSFIEKHGEEIALILIGGVNYYTGQAFDMAKIAAAGQAQGCTVGFDLAHAAGNVAVRLHDWNVDFAAWCSYKYLNAGPGGLSGVFVHERHGNRADLPRFSGWWGHDQQTRFLMHPEFKPMPGAEGWQLSNPPILPLASLRASLEIFDEAGIQNLCKKSCQLTNFMEFLMDQIGTERIMSITPRDPVQRGCQLSLVVRKNARAVFDQLTKAGVICDWREPDVIRIAPVPLYNSFEDVFRFYKMLREILA